MDRYQARSNVICPILHFLSLSSVSLQTLSHAPALKHWLASAANTFITSTTKPPRRHTYRWSNITAGYHGRSRVQPEWSRDCSRISSVIEIPLVILQNTCISVGTTFTFFNWHCSLDIFVCWHWLFCSCRAHTFTGRAIDGTCVMQDPLAS